MAMEAAMTGHLVFSTVHTNSSAETITRVTNLGAKNFMIAGTFNLVIAQRLCRKICSKCKERISINDTERHLNARESFQHFDRNELKKEIDSRQIDFKTRNDFINDGVCYHGSGKDPDTGDICSKCEGS